MQTSKEMEVLNIIIESFESVHSPKYKEIIQKLFSYESEFLSYFDIILNILCNYNSLMCNMRVSQKNIIMSYVSKVIHQAKNQRDIAKIPQIEIKVVKILKMFISTDFDSNTTREIMNNIIRGIIPIILKTDNPMELLKKLFNNIKQYDINRSKIPKKDMFLKILVIMQELIDSIIEIANEKSDFNFIFEYYNSLLNQTEHFAFNEQNSNTQQKISDNVSVVNSVILAFCKSSLNLFDYFIDNEIKKNNTNDNIIISKLFIENEQFIQFIYKSLFLCYNSETKEFSHDNLIITINDDTLKEYQNEFNDTLLQQKRTLFVLLSKISRKMIENNLIENFSQFLNLNNIVLNKLIEIMLKIKNQKNFIKEGPNNSIKEYEQLLLLIYLLGYFEVMCKCSVGVKIMSSIKYELYKIILIPRLLPTQLEMNIYQKNAKEYIENIIDQSDEHKVIYPKNKTILLLVTICENIDGFMNFVVMINIQILYSLTNCSDMISNYTTNEYKDIFYCLIKEYAQSELIDQSLLVLTALSNQIQKRPQIRKYLSEIISKINSILININDNLLKARLCMFYRNNLLLIFKDDSGNIINIKAIEEAVIFLFNCMLQEQQSLPLIYIALNSINHIIFDKDFLKSCDTIVSPLIPKVIHFSHINNISYYAEDYDEFIKGIIINYISNPISIFNLYLENLESCWKQSFSNKIQNYNKREVLKERKEDHLYKASIYIKLITLIISLISSKGVDIKKEIYLKVLELSSNLNMLFNFEYEEEILGIIITSINDIKTLPSEYSSNFVKYIENFNNSHDGIFDYSIEEYHIYFIFTFLNSLPDDDNAKYQINVILFNIISSRLSYFPKNLLDKKVLIEHYYYTDFLLVFIIFSYSKLTVKDISNISKVIVNRMESPYKEKNIYTKLYLSFFILLLPLDNFDCLRELNMNKIIITSLQCFPNKKLSLIEHEIISSAYCILIRYIILTKGEEGSYQMYNAQTLFKMISIILCELHSIHKLTMTNKKRELKEDNELKEIEMDDEGLNKQRKGKFGFSEREEKFRKEDDEEFDKRNKKEEYKTKEDLTDSDDENEKDKVNEFINENVEQVEQNKKHSIEEYFKQFGYKGLAQRINAINYYQIFHSMLIELQSDNEDLFKQTINLFTPKKYALINKYCSYQKIKLNKDTNNEEYIYRKILKLKLK